MLPNGDPMGDPIFPDKPVIPVPEGHPQERHPKGGTDWVVVHRGGEGSKAHVEALERKLIHAHINARVQEEAAIAALGDGNSHGAGENAHQSREERIEAEEHAQLTGAFAATQWKWLLVLLAVAVLALLAFWFVPLFHL
jgi:hypothetical protein